MAKTTMRVKMFHNGTWRIIEEEGKRNPFCLKYENYYGTKTIDHFATLTDALLELVAIVNNGKHGG